MSERVCGQCKLWKPVATGVTVERAAGETESGACTFRVPPWLVLNLEHMPFGYGEPNECDNLDPQAADCPCFEPSEAVRP